MTNDSYLMTVPLSILAGLFIIFIVTLISDIPSCQSRIYDHPVGSKPTFISTGEKVRVLEQVYVFNGKCTEINYGHYSVAFPDGTIVHEVENNQLRRDIQ